MPRSQRYTVRRPLDITPAMSRQLDRLSRHHERAVPDLIRQAYGPPSDKDRQPSLPTNRKSRPQTATNGGSPGSAEILRPTGVKGGFAFLETRT